MLSFIRRPAVHLFVRSASVTIGEDIPVTVRVVTGRWPAEVVDARLELRAVRAFPSISYVYGVVMKSNEVATVVEAPFDCARRIEAHQKVEIDAALATKGVLLGPTCQSGPVGLEYQMRVALGLAGGDTAKGPLFGTLELRNAPSLYASAAGYRDTWDTDPTGEIDIELHTQVIAPGDLVRGVVLLRPRVDLGPIEQVTLAVVRRAEFVEPTVPGSIDVKEAVETTIDVDLPRPVQPGSLESVPFELPGPPQPTCYDGERFNLRWFVGVAVKRAGAPNTALRAELNVCSALLPPQPAT